MSKSIKKAKLFFPENKYYNGEVFEGGKVHEIEERHEGFIQRWIKRGCSLIQAETPAVVEEKDIIEESEISEEEKEESEVIENVEVVEEKKTKKKTKKKAQSNIVS